jgi:hypothetical protein
MTRPMGDEVHSQLDVEHEGDRLSGLCEQVTHEIARRAREAAACDAAYKDSTRRRSSWRRGRSRPAKRRPTPTARTRTGNAARPRRAHSRAQLDWQRSKNANLRPLVSP